MKHTLWISCWLAAIVECSAGMRAGIAVRVVTPDPLLPVIGGIGRSHTVQRKEGDLTVRALVLEDGTNRVAIVSTDFLGFPGLLGDRVRAAVKEVPAQNILIGATHTHSAPDMYGFPDGNNPTSCDPKYLELVCRKIAESIHDAVEHLQATSLRIGTGEARGRIAYNYYAPELYDPRCNVIQALDESKKPIATLVNYAVHPEVLGSEAGLCSPDLVGPLYDEIAARGGGVGIFMNSAQGGMVTADNRTPEKGESRSWHECKRIGKLLADEALKIAESAQVQNDPHLLCAAKKLSLPVDSPQMRGLMKAMPGFAGQSSDAVTTQLNVINVGTAQILTIPGEALPNIGYYLKRKMRGEFNLLFGLTNDAYGYILTREDFDSFKRYAYVTRTSLGERTGTIFVDEALKFVNELPQPASPK